MNMQRHHQAEQQLEEETEATLPLRATIPLSTVADRIAAFDAGHTVQFANEIGLRAWMTATAETVRTVDGPAILWRVKPFEQESDGGFYGRLAAREGRQAVILSEGLRHITRAPSTMGAEQLRDLARVTLDDAAQLRRGEAAHDAQRGTAAREPAHQPGDSHKASGREIWRGHDGELVGMRRTTHVPLAELAEIVEHLRRSVSFESRRACGGVVEAPRAGGPAGTNAEIADTVVELLRRHDLLPYHVDANTVTRPEEA